MLRKALAIAIVLVGFGVAYQLGTARAVADVNPGNPGPIAMVGGLTWGSDGSCWLADDSPSGWYPLPGLNLPIPAVEVAMVGEDQYETVLVATDGRCWRRIGQGWLELAPYPSGPGSIEAATWGQIKGAHR